jgi:hypothetical protein
MRQAWKYLVLLTGAGLASAGLIWAQTGPKTFASPEEARDALIQAAGKGIDAVRDIMGPGAIDILRTGDSIQDKAQLDTFKQRAAEKTQLEPDQMNPNRVRLLLGEEEWPFAIPIMKKSGRWYFDLQEGKAEVRRRVIGGNELDAIEACRGFVEAEVMYSETDWNGNGKREYAAKIASTPGKKDGLYWPGDDSPIGAQVARAMAQGYSAPGTNSKGYHGYQYRILLAQGADADSGAQDYVAHGMMIGGFALIAWPVEYGVSGIKSFIVNQDGIVYEKDLGPQTSTAVKAITKFNPDKSWAVSVD